VNNFAPLDLLHSDWPRMRFDERGSEAAGFIGALSEVLESANLG
jgi:hypothetical protein